VIVVGAIGSLPGAWEWARRAIAGGARASDAPQTASTPATQRGG
jgi:hypothetical protein